MPNNYKYGTKKLDRLTALGAICSLVKCSSFLEQLISRSIGFVRQGEMSVLLRERAHGAKRGLEPGKGGVHSIRDLLVLFRTVLTGKEGGWGDMKDLILKAI